MKLDNKVMLITYADSMGKNLKELHKALNTYYKNAVGGVHILPFFPSSADRGFAPMCYTKVDEAFGDFSDVEAIGAEYYLMFDFMVNHISASSEYFKDFLEKKDFLSLEGKEVWNLGIDSSISLNERMVSEEGNRFLTDCYDDIIGLDSSVMAVELEKRYSDYVIEDER